MQLPDERQRHDEYEHVGQDIRRRDVAIKGLLVETSPARDILVPGILHGRALEDGGEEHANSVAEHDSPDNAGEDAELVGAEDAHVEQQDGDLGGRDGEGEIEDLVRDEALL